MDSPRSVTSDDLPGIIALLDGIFRLEKGVTDQTVQTDFPLLFATENLDYCRVIERNGQIVSHAAVWPRTLVVEGVPLKVGIIVLVATAHDHRHQRLADTLMRDLQRSMFNEQFDLGILWTGVPAFYEQLGWHGVTPRGWLAHTAPVSSPPEDIRTYDRHLHLEVLHHLHQQSGIYTRRTLAETAALLELPGCEVSVLHSENSPVAYLVDAHAVNKRGLIEYAGPSERVWSLVAAASHDGDQRPFLIFPTHEDLVQNAHHEGWAVAPLPSCKGFGDEMQLVLNPDIATPAVLDRLFVWGLDQA